MTTFGVSIAVPPPYADPLRAARHRAGDDLADAVSPHVTLMPPTEVPEHGETEFEAHLEAVALAHRTFRVTLRGTGTFRPTSDVVFVALAEGIGRCEEIERDLRRGPVARSRDFPFHPHVTIAHGVAPDLLDRAFADQAGFTASFEVTGFDLHRHGGDQGGDRSWRPVRHFALRG